MRIRWKDQENSDCGLGIADGGNAKFVFIGTADGPHRPTSPRGLGTGRPYRFEGFKFSTLNMDG